MALGQQAQQTSLPELNLTEPLNLMEGEWRQLKYHDLRKRHFDTKEDLRHGVGGANWGIAI